MSEITRNTMVVNVNKHVIAKNIGRPPEEVEPPLAIQKGKSGKRTYGHAVAVLDANGEEVARFIYDPHNPLLSCGARLVLVAHHGARIVDRKGTS